MSGNNHTRGNAVWLRMAGEFFVIVVSVLVALAVDSWVSSRTERQLEKEYLLRLLDDVRYDLGEIGFVTAITTAGLAYADSLLMQPGRWSEPDRLVGAVLIAANARVPDLSRNTLQELVNSGRIALLRSAEVRQALAQYDRTVIEQASYWTITSYGLSDWADARIPNRVQVAFDAACGDSPDPNWSRLLAACPFELDTWSADALRKDLESEEARRLLSLYTSRHGRALDILAELRTAAQSLESVLEQHTR